MTRDELIALLQQRRNNDVIVYVPESDGALMFEVEGVDYDEVTDRIVIDTEAFVPDEVTFADADDRRGFQVLVNGEKVGGEITYDDFGWDGIHQTERLVAALAQVLGAEVKR